jgi:hypothetical protein
MIIFSINYQFYIVIPLNYHFVTKTSIPSVKDVKLDGQRLNRTVHDNVHSVHIVHDSVYKVDYPT